MGLNVAPGDVAITKVAGGRAQIEIKVAQADAIPGMTKFLANAKTTTVHANGSATLRLLYDGNMSLVGYTDITGKTASGSTFFVTGETPGRDFWIAPDNASYRFEDIGTGRIEVGAAEIEASDDIVIGHGGADTLLGGTGWDWIDGGSGNDLIRGVEGDDVLLGSSGNDTLDAGGSGGQPDFASYQRSATGVTASLGNRSINTDDARGDVYVGIEGLIGSDLDDVLHGDDGANFLWGEAGDDILVLGKGADVALGGFGFDVVSYRTQTAGITINLTMKANSSAVVADDLFVDVEAFEATDFNDTLIGRAAGDVLAGRGGNDRLEGLDGDDALDGGGGNDHLIGGTGNDVLSGRTGDDLLIGGTGTDRLDGGAGMELAQYSEAASAVRVDLAGLATNTGEAAGGVLISVENLHGSRYSDDLRGNAQANVLWGYDGNDVIRGRQGDDHILHGSAFNDDLRGDARNNVMWGWDGNDMMHGQDGNDHLLGGIGDDSLWGGRGADLLQGQDREDILYGGAGDGQRDVFVFNATSESQVGSRRDVVYDFVSGIDDFDFAAIDANTGAAGTQAFVFSGTTANAHAIWFAVNGSDILVRADNTGDKVAAWKSWSPISERLLQETLFCEGLVNCALWQHVAMEHMARSNRVAFMLWNGTEGGPRPI